MPKFEYFWGNVKLRTRILPLLFTQFQFNLENASNTDPENPSQSHLNSWCVCVFFFVFVENRYNRVWIYAFSSVMEIEFRNCCVLCLNIGSPFFLPSFLSRISITKHCISIFMAFFVCVWRVCFYFNDVCLSAMEMWIYILSIFGYYFYQHLAVFYGNFSALLSWSLLWQYHSMLDLISIFNDIVNICIWRVRFEIFIAISCVFRDFSFKISIMAMHIVCVCVRVCVEMAIGKLYGITHWIYVFVEIYMATFTAIASPSLCLWYRKLSIMAYMTARTCNTKCTDFGRVPIFSSFQITIVRKWDAKILTQHTSNNKCLCNTQTPMLNGIGEFLVCHSQCERTY